MGFELEWPRVDAKIDYYYVTAVSAGDTAGLELPTDGYNDLRAYIGANVPLQNNELTFFVQGRNLTDDEQRRHTSFIKDTVPLPGRTVEAGVRLKF